MDNYYDFDDDLGDSGTGGFGSILPPPLRAAIFVSVGLLILNTVTFITAGTGAILSLPLLILVYLSCGALAGNFSLNQDPGANPIISGVAAGVILWVISFLMNALLTLVLGAPSLGLSFLVGIPYICLCAPVELLAGAILGSFGGFLYGVFGGGGNPSSSDGY